MEYLIVFNKIKTFDTNNLSNFITIYESDLKSLHRLAATLLNKGHTVYCLFEDKHLIEMDIKPSEIEYFKSYHHGTYVLLKIDSVNNGGPYGSSSSSVID